MQSFVQLHLFRLILAVACLGALVLGCAGSMDSGPSGGGSGGRSGSGGHSGSGGAGETCVVSSPDGGSQYANFATVRQIVQIKWGGASCHNSGIQMPTMQDDDNLYPTLLGYTSHGCGHVLVDPCHPDESAFYLVQHGKCGTIPQMPNGCISDPNDPNFSCIPPDYVEGVRQWIANGAPQD